MITEEKQALSAHTNALLYELRLSIHALTRLVADLDTAAVDRTNLLLDRVVSVARECVDQGWIVSRPFAYVGDSTPIGPGALLLEYLDPGRTGLQHLVEGLDDGLMSELDRLVTRGEKATTPPAGSNAPFADGIVQLPLEPVADWTVLARATVAFSPADVVHETRGVLPAAAAAEIEDALNDVRRLVSDLARPQPAKIAVRVEFDGVESPSMAATGACSAAIALTYLAQEARLPTPAQLGVLPLACFTECEGWAGCRDRDTFLKGASEEGLRPLWLDDQGWHLGTPEISDSDRSLAGAARMLWGQNWDGVCDRWAQERLERLEWRVLHGETDANDDATGWLRGDGSPLVKTSQSEWLVDRFTRAPHSRVILSGYRNSGKSVCARLLTGQLEAGGHQVVVIAPVKRQLPAEGELPAIVRAAARVTGLARGHRSLIIIEDIHSLDDGTIGRAMGSLGDVDAGVLALTSYVDGMSNDWDFKGVTAYLTDVRTTVVRDLAQALVTGYPDVFPTIRDEDLDDIVAACQGDLQVLVDVLAKGADNSSQPGSVGDLLRQQAARATEALGEDANTDVCRIAAVSVFHDMVPESHVATLSADTQHKLGIVLLDGLARITSRVRAEAVLAAAGSAGEDQFLDHIEGYLARLLREDNAIRLQAFLDSCAAYDPVRLTELLARQSLRTAIGDWVAHTHPAAALRVLQLCGGHSHTTQWIGDALPSVVGQVPGIPDLTVRTLTAALEMLWSYQEKLPDASLAQTLCAWVGEPGGGLDTLLARPSRIQQRYALVQALLRLAGEDAVALEAACSWVKSRAEKIIQDADVRDHLDLIYIRRLDDLLFRKSRAARAALGTLSGQNGLRPLEKPAQRILSQPPTIRTPLPAVLAWLSLLLHFEGGTDWMQLIQQYGDQIKRGVSRSDPTQVGTALADLARTNRGLCTKLLNSLDLTKYLRTALYKAQPAEAAILISTLRNIHGVSVKQLLYDNAQGSPRANPQLVEYLARTTVQLKDLRGAGMLLSSTAKADNLYCDTSEGFAHSLAREIGAEGARKLVELERRPAIIYHFLRGLWAAEADYRENLEEHALNLVVASIAAQRNSTRPWGPRLATLLIQDEYFGQTFLQKLVERLDSNLLLRRMLNGGLDPTSMEHTHQLGLVLDPAMGERFRHEIDLDRHIDAILTGRPSQVAQRLQVTAKSLLAGGLETATPLVLKHLRERAPGWNWSQKIDRIRDINSFVETMDNLRKLDVGEASLVMKDLLWNSGSHLSPVEELLVRSVVDPKQTADLLVTIERCEAGLGKQALAGLRARGGRWATFIETFGHEQDPIDQSVVGRRMAPLGLMPDEEPTSWMKTLVERVWASTLPSLAGPMAVSSILRLAYVWNPQWGEQLATEFESRKLLKRLSLGMTSDLQSLPNLATILRLTDRIDLVENIAGCVNDFEPQDLANTMGLRSSALWVQALRHAGLDSTEFVGALASLLDRTLSRSVVVNAEEHWTSIGWAAHTLTEHGFGDLIADREPALAPKTVPHAASIAWAMTWLPSTEWTKKIQSEALDVFERGTRGPQLGLQAGMALVAAARSGQLAEADSLDTRWSAVVEANPSLLALLLREVNGTPALRSFFETDSVAARMWEMARRTDVQLAPLGDELIASVKRLCPASPSNLGGRSSLDI